MYNKEKNCLTLMQQTSYPRNEIPTNQQNVHHPLTLAPANENDSTVRHSWGTLHKPVSKSSMLTWMLQSPMLLGVQLATYVPSLLHLTNMFSLGRGTAGAANLSSSKEQFSQACNIRTQLFNCHIQRVFFLIWQIVSEDVSYR